MTDTAEGSSAVQRAPESTNVRLSSSGSASLSPGPDLQQLAKDAYEKTAVYVRGQMEGLYIWGCRVGEIS